METLIWIILSTFIVSALSLVGIFTLALKEKLLQKILMVLVSLSAGALMGNAFIHLLPESFEFLSTENSFMFLLAGFVVFFIVEKVFHWRHCHDENCKIHSFAYMNLFGDSIHNFIDGLIIAASFVTNMNLGIATTLAVMIHEIPQEIGDFGVLLHGKFTVKRALLMNFITALTAVLGGICGYFISELTSISMIFLLPVAAGGFIYIAASDLIPEIRKEPSMKKSALNLVVFVLGIVLMIVLNMVAHG